MELIDNKLKERNIINIDAIILSIFLILFPIDSALGNIIGSVSLNNYIAICAFVFVFIIRFYKKEIAVNKSVIIISLYFLYQLFSIIIGSGLNSRNLIFLFYFILALVVGFVDWNDREKEFFELCFVLGMIIAIAIVLLNYTPGSNRLYLSIGRNIDQNYFSSNFIFATAILTKKMYNNKYKLIYCFILVLEFLVIFLLGSRTGLLGNLAVVCIYTLFTKKYAILYLLIFLMLYFIIFYQFSDILPDWVIRRFSYEKVLHSTGSGRTIIWKDYLHLFRDSSFKYKIFGNGRGIIYDENFYRIGTHNIYIKNLIEGGLIGVIFQMIFYGNLFYISIKNKNILTLSILIGFCVCGMFLDLEDYRIFAMLIAVVLSYNKNFNIKKPFRNKQL